MFKVIKITFAALILGAIFVPPAVNETVELAAITVPTVSVSNAAGIGANS